MTYILKLKNSGVVESGKQVMEALNIKTSGTDLREELNILNTFHQNPDAFQGKEGFTDQVVSQLNEFYNNFQIFGVNLGSVPQLHRCLECICCCTVPDSVFVWCPTADYDHLYPVDQ